MLGLLRFVVRGSVGGEGKVLVYGAGAATPMSRGAMPTLPTASNTAHGTTR